MSRGQQLLNAVMRAVLATPMIHRAVSNRVLVITVVGRRTGRPYTFPVGYVASGDTLLIGTSAGWRRNLRPGWPVAVTVARRRRAMAAEVVTDLASAVPLYREILAHNPVHGRYAKIRHAADGTPDVDDLRAGLARGLAVVVLRPATSREPTTMTAASSASA